MPSHIGERRGKDRKGEERTGEDRTGEDRRGQERTGQDRTGRRAEQRETSKYRVKFSHKQNELKHYLMYCFLTMEKERGTMCKKRTSQTFCAESIDGVVSSSTILVSFVYTESFAEACAYDTFYKGVGYNKRKRGL